MPCPTFENSRAHVLTRELGHSFESALAGQACVAHEMFQALWASPVHCIDAAPDLSRSVHCYFQPASVSDAD